MSITDRLKRVQETAPTGEFASQIDRHDEFWKRMRAAGVVAQKRDFTIPLIERIGTMLHALDSTKRAR